MKRLILCAAVLGLMMTGCNSMEKDAKKVANKTCECYSLLDLNSQTNDEEAYSNCIKELEDLEKSMNEKYSSPDKKEKFFELKYKAVMNSDMPDEFKEIFDEIYSIHNSNPGDIPLDIDIEDDIPEDEDVD